MVVVVVELCCPTTAIPTVALKSAARLSPKVVSIASTWVGVSSFSPSPPPPPLSLSPDPLSTLPLPTKPPPLLLLLLLAPLLLSPPLGIKSWASSPSPSVEEE